MITVDIMVIIAILCFGFNRIECRLIDILQELEKQGKNKDE